MFYEKLSKYQLEKQSWFRVIHCFGNSIKALSDETGIPPSTLSTWFNRENLEEGMKIPYEFTLKVARITGISIDDLAPFRAKTNENVKIIGSRGKVACVQRLIHTIDDTNFLEGECFVKHKTIIIDTTGSLIAGSALLESCKRTGAKKTTVTVLDLYSILLETQLLENINTNFFVNLLTQERIAIGLHMERLIGNGQGQRNDLVASCQKSEINRSQEGSLLPTWGEVKGRKDIKIAKLLGYSTNTYYRAKEVCRCGILGLVDALGKKQIPVSVAAEIATSPKGQQQEELQRLGLLSLDKTNV